MIELGIKRKQNGVPDLYKKDIEEIGSCIIDDYCPDLLRTPQALDIDHFAEFYLGANLDYRYLSTDCRFLGMCVFNDTDKVIIYDEDTRRAEYFSVCARTIIIDKAVVIDPRQEHRYRFSLGHECGHLIKDSEYYCYNPNQLELFGHADSPMITCKQSSIEGVFKGDPKYWDDRTRMEWQADTFSAVLLMNKESIRELMKQLGTSSNSVMLNYDRVVNISKIYNVSLKAAEIRLRNLGYIDVEDRTDYSSSIGRFKCMFNIA